MAMGEPLLHSLAGLPACNISVATRQQLTELFSQQLQSLPLAEAALACGYLSDTVATAFFFGYQCAVRHLDPALGHDEFAALAASERGIRSSREFETRVTQRQGAHFVSGTKSHVMLLERGLLDAVYVLANNHKSELQCVKVLTSSAGFSALDAVKEQSFLMDVPHTPAIFDNCLCEPNYCVSHAHKNVFKPFRYWEDVMVSLSYAGWLIRKLSDSHSTAFLLNSTVDLAAAYDDSPDYFSQDSLSLIDKLLAEMLRAAAGLKSSFSQEWQQDSALLRLGAVAREKVKVRL